MRYLYSFLITLSVLLAPLRALADPRPHPQVVVVGGGIAGLVTAWKLEQKGYTTCVLEASDRLGGRIGTAHYDNGLQAEYGMQEIWEKSPLVGIVKELGLKLDSSDDPWSSLIIGDHLYPFTQKTREAYFQSLFNPAERKAFDAALAELEANYTDATTRGLTDRMQNLQDISFAEWLKAHNLPPKVEMALRLTIEVELATVAERFSALSAVLEYRTFLFGGEKNFHVPGGNAEIIAALARALHGPIIRNAQVTHVIRTREGGKLHAQVRYIQDSDIHSIDADAVVVAVPWVNLHQIQFEPGLTPEQLEALDHLGRGQYTVVHLLLDRAVTKLWDKGNPFPILSNGPLGVIYGPHATSTTGPEIVFSFLIYGPQAEAYHMVPRDTKRDELLKAMDQYFPGFSGYVKEVRFYSYHPAAVTYWPRGRSPLDAGSEAIRTPHEGLFLAGDWTESSHAEGAVRSAYLTVDKVSKFLKESR